MDLQSIPLMAATKKRLSWLAQRQEVLAQNVANADTPGYRPKDLKEFGFRELVRREATQVNMSTTGPDHLGGRRRRIRDFATETERRPFETAPAGNAVVLEEQMAKVNETQLAHKLTTELYRKHLGLFRAAVGNRP